MRALALFLREELAGVGRQAGLLVAVAVIDAPYRAG